MPSTQYDARFNHLVAPHELAWTEYWASGRHPADAHVLLSIYYPIIRMECAAARRRTRGHPLLEFDDLVQEMACLSVSRLFAGYDPAFGRPFVSWFRSIVRFRVRDVIDRFVQSVKENPPPQCSRVGGEVADGLVNKLAARSKSVDYRLHCLDIVRVSCGLGGVRRSRASTSDLLGLAAVLAEDGEAEIVARAHGISASTLSYHKSKFVKKLQSGFKRQQLVELLCG